MKETTYDISEKVLNETGSLREIGLKLGISKAYASVLQKARSDCAAQVLDYWRSGEVPFNLVRALSNLTRTEQLPVLRKYIKDSRDKPTEERKEALRCALRAVRAVRGMGLSEECRTGVLEEARQLYQEDDCEIDNLGKITKTDEGYWVPAHVFVPVAEKE